MIEKDTEAWDQLLDRLNRSKSKSNRDVLCSKCWKIYSYETNNLHKISNPDHVKSVMTSKAFASENDFFAVALQFDKVVSEGDKIYVENPYKDETKRTR